VPARPLRDVHRRGATANGGYPGCTPQAMFLPELQEQLAGVVPVCGMGDAAHMDIPTAAVAVRFDLSLSCL
jgi:hypothetical protein